MQVVFDEIPETVIPRMRGGAGEVRARMFTDQLGKIMRGTLPPGASIGMHSHETSSEDHLYPFRHGEGSLRWSL